MVNCNAPGRITTLIMNINFANELTKLVDFNVNLKSVSFTRTHPRPISSRLFSDFFNVGNIVGESRKMAEIGVEMLNFFQGECQTLSDIVEKINKA